LNQPRNGGLGNQGQFSQYATPGLPNFAPTGTDKKGNFWYFDGYSLWQFDPTIAEWAWMGPSRLTTCNSCQDFGTWGKVGVADAENWPSGRSGSMGWSDVNGDLWILGGTGTDASYAVSGYLNDLWKFDTSSGIWTWEAGSDFLYCNEYDTCTVAGTYGSQGVPAAANAPGSRQNSIIWTDSSGHFWLYGGVGWDSAYTLGNLDDMWEFDPVTGEWTWIAGSNTAEAANGPVPVFGMQGTPAAANNPGGRTSAAAWTDGNNHFWLFGGNGYLEADANGPNAGTVLFGQLNDLWEFDPALKQWTFWGGTQVSLPGTEYSGPVLGLPAAYGTLGVPAPGNLPGARSNATTWTDNAGNFWLHGGAGYDAGYSLGWLNDLWEFNPSTQLWTWMSGDSTLCPPPGFGVSGCNAQPGVFGTIGVPAAGNEPGGTQGDVGWSDLDGNLWLYTGQISFYDPTLQIGNIWLYHPATSTMPRAAPPAFSVGEGTYTTAQSVTLTDATSGSTIYYTLDGTLPTMNSAVYSGPIAISTNTTLQAIATAADHFNSVVVSTTYTITPGFSVTASPASLTVNAGSRGNTMVSVTAAGGFDAAVSFACSGLPAGATCSFLPATVTPPGTTSTTLTVTASSAAAAVHRRGLPVIPEAAVAIALCWFGWRKRRSWPMLLLLAVGLSGVGLVNGCGSGGGSGGGGGGGGGGTQPVVSTVTVTATSGTLQQTTTFTLTVN
jgi:N-acetylneuraminic acid mutarotase